MVEEGVIALRRKDEILVLNFREDLLFGLFLKQLLLGQGLSDEQGEDKRENMTKWFKHSDICGIIIWDVIIQLVLLIY